jgi:hypothetical protein
MTLILGAQKKMVVTAVSQSRHDKTSFLYPYWSVVTPFTGGIKAEQMRVLDDLPANPQDLITLSTI